MLKNDVLCDVGYFINQCDYFKNSYFFQSPGLARARRKYEEENSISKFTVILNNDEYELEFTVNCSCNNVYVYKTIVKNGVRTNLKALRNSYKKELEGQSLILCKPQIWLQNDNII